MRFLKYFIVGIVIVFAATMTIACPAVIWLLVNKMGIAALIVSPLLILMMALGWIIVYVIAKMLEEDIDGRN